MEITVVNPNAKPVTVAIQDKSVIGVTQPGPNFVVSPVNLLSISSILNAYGDLINPGVDAGIGIAVNGDVVSIKNAANLSNGILPKWDITNGQFVDSIVQEQAGVVYVNGGLESNYWQADLLASTTAGVGKLRWDDVDGTLEFGLKGGNVNLQLGQEQVVRVVNKAGLNLLEANYQAVKITGAQGNRLKIGLARADSDPNSADTIGIVTETIANNQEGFVTSSGLVRNINTTGSLQGETWLDGNVLYLSPTTYGAITNIKPQAPQHTVILGFVVRAHATQGQIYVKVDNGYEIDELHNIKINSVANGQFLVYNSTLGVWENKTVNTGVNGTGIADYVARWLDTDTLTTGVLYDNGTNVGVGTTSPATKLHVDGTAYATLFSSLNGYQVGQSSISQAGNSNLIIQNLGWGFLGRDIDINPNRNLNIAGVDAYFNNTQSVTFSNGQNVIFSNGGNVGINTTSPAQKLHVVGTIRQTAVISSLLKTNASGDLVAATAGTDYQAPITNPVTGTGVATRVAFWSSTSALSSNSNLYWDNTNSRLGIGTTTPGDTLTVVGTFRSTSLWTTSLGVTQWGASGTAYGILTWDTGFARIHANTGNRLDLGANGGLHMSISTTGNVGIGTTTPESISSTTTLTINGSAGGGAVSFQVGGVRTGLLNGNDNYLTIQSYASRPLSLGYNGNNTIVVNTSNNVGIGTTSPGVKLDVSGDIRTSNVFYGSSLFVNLIRMNGGTELPFRNSSNTELARLTSTGEFGIGTTTPSQKLHVVGNAYVTGAYYDATNTPGTSGQLLSSTITGTQWIDPPITGNTLQKYTETFVATSGQTIFVTTNTLTTNNFDVFLNGSKLTPSEYTVNTSTKTITLTTGARSNDIVEVIVFSTNNLALAPIPNVSVVTSTTYTISVNDEVLLINTSVGQTIQLTLPSASAANNRNYTIKNIGLGKVDILPASANTIDGESLIQIENQYTSLSLFPYLSNWYII